jgi:hypothetical protein
MPTLARTASDPPQSLLDRIQALGVEVVRWTGTSGDDHAVLDRGSTPRLYLVEPDAAPPPYWGSLEDWARLPAPALELLDRANTLLRRAGAIDAIAQLDDTLLRIGGRLIFLSSNEASLLRALLDRPGHIVPRDDVVAAVWPNGPPSDPRALDNPLSTLRKRLAGTSLHIHVVRERGLLIDGSAA